MAVPYSLVIPAVEPLTETLPPAQARLAAVAQVLFFTVPRSGGRPRSGMATGPSGAGQLSAGGAPLSRGGTDRSGQGLLRSGQGTARSGAGRPRSGGLPQSGRQTQPSGGGAASWSARPSA